MLQFKIMWIFWFLKMIKINDFSFSMPSLLVASFTFGYCRCLLLCVCQSVCQLLACPRDNSGSVQARITKFGPKVQNYLVKVPVVLWSYPSWPSRSNLRSKWKFTLFQAFSHHNSSPTQARIAKFGPEVQNTSVKIPVVLRSDWLWPSSPNLT